MLLDSKCFGHTWDPLSTLSFCLFVFRQKENLELGVEGNSLHIAVGYSKPFETISSSLVLKIYNFYKSTNNITMNLYNFFSFNVGKFQSRLNLSSHQTILCDFRKTNFFCNFSPPAKKFFPYKGLDVSSIIIVSKKNCLHNWIQNYNFKTNNISLFLSVDNSEPCSL